MSELKFLIGKKPITVEVEGDFQLGSEVVLSSCETDITYSQDWYSEGYSIQELFTEDEFESLLKGLTDSVREIVERHSGMNCEGFSLETYHRFVNDDALHFAVVGETRDLFPENFNLNVARIQESLAAKVGMLLTDLDPNTGRKMHIIVRINRPFSNDFNPPHKDIYEAYDGAVEGYEQGDLPRFMNFWIPIAGVTSKSSLPLAPKSHLIPESKVHRTTEGGVVRGNQYRVRMIAEWGGMSEMERASVEVGQVLMFSGFLIHGLAANEEKDKTRVALEFRLFS